MKRHKYEKLIKFIKLDGIKEFKETDPSLFSKDGISTSTLSVENNKIAIVKLEDISRACKMFLNDELTLFQFQQWGEWLHLGDMFDYDVKNEDDIVELLSLIDNIDLVDKSNLNNYVNDILNKTER